MSLWPPGQDFCWFSFDQVGTLKPHWLSWSVAEGTLKVSAREKFWKEGREIKMSLNQTEQKFFKNQASECVCDSSTLQRKYSRRVYRPEVDQSNRTAKQKMRWWRETQANSATHTHTKKNYWKVKINETQLSMNHEKQRPDKGERWIKRKPVVRLPSESWKTEEKVQKRWRQDHHLDLANHNYLLWRHFLWPLFSFK